MDFLSVFFSFFLYDFWLLFKLRNGRGQHPYLTKTDPLSYGSDKKRHIFFRRLRFLVSFLLLRFPLESILILLFLLLFSRWNHNWFLSSRRRHTLSFFTDLKTAEYPEFSSVLNKSRLFTFNLLQKFCFCDSSRRLNVIWRRVSRVELGTI